jgi:chitodextrinase
LKKLNTIRFLTLMIIAVFAVSIILPGIAGAAHTIGLLNGSAWSKEGVTTTYTQPSDGDHLSGVNVNTDTSVLYLDILSANINKIYADVTNLDSDGNAVNTSLNVELYDSLGTLVHTETFSVLGATTVTTASVISDVTKVRIVSSATGESVGVSEVEIYKAPDDTTPPGEVTNLAETHTDTTADLTFTNPTDADFSHVKVYRDTVLVGDNITTGSFSDTGLTSGSSYTYKVTTIDTLGNESLGTEIVVSTNDVTPPAEVTNLTETHTDTTVDLSWSNPLDTDFSNVNIYQDGVKIATGVIGTTYSVTGLTKETTYSFKVTTVDTSGNESAGNSISAITAPDTTAPSAPTGLDGSAGNGFIVLNWDSNTEVDLAGYNIFMSSDAGLTFSQLNTNLVTKSDFYVDGLTNGTEYQFYVIAVDTSKNESLQSTTLLKAPSETGDITDADFAGLVGNMNDVFENSKLAGLIVVGSAIGIGLIFIAGRWAWARLRQWLTKAG